MRCSVSDYWHGWRAVSFWRRIEETESIRMFCYGILSIMVRISAEYQSMIKVMVVDFGPQALCQ